MGENKDEREKEREVGVLRIPWNVFTNINTMYEFKLFKHNIILRRVLAILITSKDL